jgi:hypothetical protein
MAMSPSSPFVFRGLGLAPAARSAPPQHLQRIHTGGAHSGPPRSRPHPHMRLPSSPSRIKVWKCAGRSLG